MEKNEIQLSGSFILKQSMLEPLWITQKCTEQCLVSLWLPIPYSLITACTVCERMLLTNTSTDAFLAA